MPTAMETVGLVVGVLVVAVSVAGIADSRLRQREELARAERRVREARASEATASSEARRAAREARRDVAAAQKRETTAVAVANEKVEEV
ncbi:predicted protein [Chaetomium globosum CBS 148.51]|uniref:Uncharacterized protein n=1 Tax=Chaetomium globosum (strain ATCC 6205 / CBS 148.51 / DSM 1962 / NBRC 6347 / NRRL 1970) TaxID=306901 RepID=Q2HDD8_CHAGB|nr:uncharacterized protein CHGG_01766 [Chaetomium globosum CBS 148.51]EAQ93531.1 predicted protein [Chaetomium globosum CBS 148.51]